MAIDVMVDIETLANSSNSIITQIAAIVFDRETGENIDTFKVNVNAQSCADIGMEMNVDTVEWWMKQDESARTSIFEQPRLKIADALQDFSNFLYVSWIRKNKSANPDDFNKNIIIWCHATFDEPNLSNAYRKCNITEPWHYRGVRDLRTLVDLTNYKINYEENKGVAHDALDDCKFQIKYTVECLNKVK